jgi:hypothetical protein
MKIVELNHIINGSFPLSGSAPAVSEGTAPQSNPVFDLKAGGLFKIDVNVDRAQVKVLGETWNSSSH